MNVKVENSGGHCEYYHCEVTHPQNPNQKVGYIANCEDIIQALGLTFDEGCEFKSIWRRGRGRQGFVKAESTALRDAIKAVHYAKRVLALEERLAAPEVHVIDASDSTGKKSFFVYPWHNAPSWACFAATGRDGRSFWYNSKPEAINGAWRYTGMSPQAIATLGHRIDWLESLEARP